MNELGLLLIIGYEYSNQEKKKESNMIRKNEEILEIIEAI